MTSVTSFILCLLVVSNTPVFGASGAWIGIQPRLDLEQGRRLELQAEYRNQGGNDHTIIRPFYTYPLTKFMRGGSGFDIFSAPEFESRIWQEFFFHTSLENTLESLRLRVRQEVRSRSGGGRVAFRARFMGDATFKLTKRIHFILFDEFFVSQSEFGSTGYSGFDRNWLGGRFVFSVLGGDLHLAVMWEHAARPTSDDGIVAIVSYWF